jgi:predicted dehydrogenase
MLEEPPKILLAICGLGGFVKRRILPTLTFLPEVELVAVVDRSMAASELSPNIVRFNSLDDLLDSNFADSVYISTPNHLHCQQTLQCLGAGRHVLCEKPMATNSRDCESMLLAAQDFKLQLTIGHMLRYSPALHEARKLLQAGKIGEPHKIEASFYYDLPENKRPWAFRKELSGGGALMDAGIHCIDAIRFLVGDTVNNIEARSDLRSTGGVDRIAKCNFTVSGVQCSLSVCSNASYSSSIIIYGDDGEIVVDSFAACWDTVTVKFISYQGQSFNQQITVDVSMIYTMQLRAFADVILSRKVNYGSAINSLENIKILEKMYELNKPL